MDMFEEKLHLFEMQAVEAIDGLMALMPLTAATESTSAAVTMLQQYAKLVQDIGQMAQNAELAGLKSVCELVESNLTILQSQENTLTSDECALLEGWPMLLFGYLANRADRESSTAFQQNLSMVWPIAASAELGSELLQLLMGKMAQLDENSVPMDESNVMSNPLTASGTQQVEREMIAVLASELAEMSEQFSTDLAPAVHGTDEERLAALGNYIDFMGRLKFTVESVGLSALASFIDKLVQQLSILGAGLTYGHERLLLQLPERLAGYLANPNDEDAVNRLVGLLADNAWLIPITPEAVTSWIESLVNVQLNESKVQEEARQVHATSEDVSLELPEDVNPELLDGLLQELPVQVGAFTAAIEHITSGHGNTQDAELAMRSAHTLKGAANTVGVPGIANLTHHLEDILVALIEAKKLPNKGLAGVLVNAGDCLEAMSEFLMGMGRAPEDALWVLQEVLDNANRIDRDGVDENAQDMNDATQAEVQENHGDMELSKKMSPVSKSELVQSLRVPATVIDEMLRLSGETLISNSQIQENLRLSISQGEIIRKQHALLQQLVADLENLVDIRNVTSHQQTIKRSDNDLDALEFEHYSELHTVTRRLIEATTDAQEMTGSVESQLNTLQELLEEQHRLQMANQHAVIRTRMVTVSSIVSRLQRGVRQTGRLLDKPVDFRIKGENTSIDGNVLNDLIDPLMHILRNAMDHGIESSKVRADAGKPEKGRVELSFAREGNSIVVRCADDGAGLDYAAIRKIAERKGMIKPEHIYKEEELARLILAPGFSTREETSQVSGRGVGLDVVYSQVLEKKGTLTLNSRYGEGLAVELRLPATLLSTHALIVRQAGKRLAISSRGIEDIRYITHEQIMEIDSRQFFREGEMMYSLVALDSMLPMLNERRSKERQGLPALLTRVEDGSVRAVLVQEILNSREVVMKNFGRFVPRKHGVIGAVILGDGSVSPVIDLVELLHVPVHEALDIQRTESAAGAMEETVKKGLSILVVDDSLSARRAMVQVLKDAAYEVRTANDGLDAVNILEKFTPDIILSDMEMPRMNGLELTAHVRYSERTKHIPVIMITSRSTEKHRQLSNAAGVNAHIVKPFSDSALLQQVASLTA
ncbi:MAG: response regulator [Gallionella sp.]|nr:response regulator [Gallionella sp.]